MKNNVIIILLLIFLYSCGNQEAENHRFTKEEIETLKIGNANKLNVKTDSAITVDLNPFLGEKHFNFGSLVSKVEIVTLETNEESLVGGIYKIVVTDSHIYIMDRFNGQGLIIFDRNGKYVKRLSHGQGPGELYRLYDFSYDKENDKLIVYQHSFMLTYSAEGKFIKQKKIPLGFYNFASIPGGYILKTIGEQGNGHLGNLQDYTLIVTNKDFQINSVGLYQKPFGKVLGAVSYLQNRENSCSVTKTYTDTIYEYDKHLKQLKAKYIMDYSSKRLPQKYCFLNTYKEWHNITDNNDYCYYIGEYLETSTTNLFYLRNSYTNLRIMAYRDKSSGNIVGGAHAHFSRDTIPPIALPISAYKDYFITVHNFAKRDTLLLNSSMISDKDKEKIKKLKFDDNPMLVFFKMKRF